MSESDGYKPLPFEVAPDPEIVPGLAKDLVDEWRPIMGAAMSFKRGDHPDDEVRDRLQVQLSPEQWKNGVAFMEAVELARSTTVGTLDDLEKGWGNRVWIPERIVRFDEVQWTGWSTEEAGTGDIVQALRTGVTRASARYEALESLIEDPSVPELMDRQIVVGDPTAEQELAEPNLSKRLFVRLAQAKVITSLTEDAASAASAQRRLSVGKIVLFGDDSLETTRRGAVGLVRQAVGLYARWSLDVESETGTFASYTLSPKVVEVAADVLENIDRVRQRSPDNEPDLTNLSTSVAELLAAQVSQRVELLTSRIDDAPEVEDERNVARDVAVEELAVTFEHLERSSNRQCEALPGDESTERLVALYRELKEQVTALTTREMTDDELVDWLGIGGALYLLGDSGGEPRKPWRPWRRRN